MQIAVYDVFVIAVVVCIGCGNKGYAACRLHGADLFRDLKRLGPDVLRNIRLRILIASDSIADAICESLYAALEPFRRRMAAATA